MPKVSRIIKICGYLFVTSKTLNFTLMPKTNMKLWQHMAAHYMYMNSQRQKKKQIKINSVMEWGISSIIHSFIHSFIHYEEDFYSKHSRSTPDPTPVKDRTITWWRMMLTRWTPCKWNRMSVAWRRWPWTCVHSLDGLGVSVHFASYALVPLSLWRCVLLAILHT